MKCKSNPANLAILALCLGLSATVSANDEHHPEQKAAGAPAATARVAKPADAQAAQAKALENNAAKLQAQARKIAKTKPGPERDKLIAEHMHSMREGLAMAGGMTPGMAMEGCPMMGGSMMGSTEKK